MHILCRAWEGGSRSAKSWFYAAASLGVVIFLLATSRLAATPEPWQPISPEELAETAPKLLPGAAAEILELKVEVDDQDQVPERVRQEYIRAKIYKPDDVKPEPLVSMLSFGLSEENDFGSSDHVVLRARLTQPDGTSELFSEEAFPKRRQAQFYAEGSKRLLGRSSQEVMARLVVAAAAKAGAILEYKIERQEPALIDRLYSLFTLQRRGMAIRKVQLKVTTPDHDRWLSRYNVLNREVAPCKIHKPLLGETLTLEASNVPPITSEPFSGPNDSYYTLSLMTFYEKKPTALRSDKGSLFVHPEGRFLRDDSLFLPEHPIVDPRNTFATAPEMERTGSWSAYSNWEYKTQLKYVENDVALQNLLNDAVGDAKDQEEKARKIYKRVQGMYISWLNDERLKKTSHFNSPGFLAGLMNRGSSIPSRGFRSSDPLTLAKALYKAAGIECRMVLLPDRRIAPFDRDIPCRAFLPHPALQVKLRSRWVFSMPTVDTRESYALRLLPFGEIPWYCEGQVALLVKDGSEEFIPVPFSDSSKSVTSNTGTFELSLDGTLTGEAKRTYTGHAASALRSEMFNADRGRQHRLFAASLKADLQGVGKPLRLIEDEAANLPPRRLTGAVLIKSISGLDTPETPVEIEYRLTLPSFAKVADQRLIFPPGLFHAAAANPFTSEKRTHVVYFPYALQDLDSISIKMPPGYKPQFTEETLPPSGQAMAYQTTLSFDEASSTLKLRREYVRNAVTVPVSAYASLKSWYETMSRIDHQEVVALGPKVPSAEIPAPASPVPEPGAGSLSAFGH